MHLQDGQSGAMQHGVDDPPPRTVLQTQQQQQPVQGEPRREEPSMIEEFGIDPGLVIQDPEIYLYPPAFFTFWFLQQLQHLFDPHPGVFPQAQQGQPPVHQVPVFPTRPPSLVFEAVSGNAVEVIHDPEMYPNFPRVPSRAPSFFIRAVSGNDMEFAPDPESPYQPAYLDNTMADPISGDGGQYPA